MIKNLQKIKNKINRTLFKQKFYTKDYLTEKKYEIGDYTYGNPKIYDWNEGATLKIGKFCSIADNVKIFLGGNHRIDWITTYPFPALKDWPEASKIKGHPATKGDVIIGNDVWIGNGATLLSGINIGDGSVIGGQAVVTANVEPYCIIAGNPARVIRKRFNDTIINKLLNLKWWNWPADKIKKNTALLCSNNIDQLPEVQQTHSNKEHKHSKQHNIK